MEPNPIPIHEDGLKAVIQALQEKPPTDTPTRPAQRTPTREDIAKGRRIYEAFERNTTGEQWGARWNFERAIRRYNRPPAPKEPNTMKYPDHINPDQRDQYTARWLQWAHDPDTAPQRHAQPPIGPSAIDYLPEVIRDV